MFKQSDRRQPRVLRDVEGELRLLDRREQRAVRRTAVLNGEPAARAVGRRSRTKDSPTAVFETMHRASRENGVVSAVRDEALDSLRRIRAARAQLRDAEVAAVRSARLGGASWTEVAAAIGTNRDAARERWQELDKE